MYFIVLICFSLRTKGTLKGFNQKELNKRAISRNAGRVKGTNRGSKNKRELSLPLCIRDKKSESKEQSNK